MAHEIVWSVEFADELADLLPKFKQYYSEKKYTELVDSVFEKSELLKVNPHVGQSSASNPKLVLLFLFLISFYCIKILSRSYGYVEMPNHRSAEPFKFCFAEENNIPKNYRH